MLRRWWLAGPRREGEWSFITKWVGYDESQNTWEPMSNLAGSENMVAEFIEKDKERRKRDELLHKQEKEAKRLAKAQKDAEDASKRAREWEETDDGSSNSDSEDPDSDPAHKKPKRAAKKVCMSLGPAE